MKVVFCTPTRDKPHAAYLAAMEATVPFLDRAGIEHSIVFEIGNPYISAAMATLARKALDVKPDALVFLDDDMSWTPESLLRLVQCDEDVVGGTYRFKKEPEEYMGSLLTGADHRPVVRADGLVLGEWLPSGFLRISAHAIHKFMGAYPELVYGTRFWPHVDLFNHGAHDGKWFGQDYAFCRNYAAKCGKVWVIPDLDITHHKGNESFPGNFHRFLLRQPGGSESDNPSPPTLAQAPGKGLLEQLRSAA